MHISKNVHSIFEIIFVSLLVSLFITSCEQINTPLDEERTQEVESQSIDVANTDLNQQIPDQYIVVFNQGVDNVPEFARSLVQQNNGTLRHTYNVALKGFSARLSPQAAAALANRPQIAYVEQDLRAQKVAQQLPEGVDRIDADQNSTANIDGSDDRVNADIAILDTGPGPSGDHPDLNVFNFINYTDDPDGDGDGHGTHVAGTAAAIDNGSHVVGVAPGARIWAYKVLDDTGGGNFSDIIAAIDNVTANAGEIEVANMSLGAQGTLNSLRTAIQNSVAAGVVYVVAAGNSAADVYGRDGVFGTGDDFIPAAYPEVAAVSAMADFDGSSGGNAGRRVYSGCGPIYDDTFVDCFSNYSTSADASNPVNSPGAAIDLAAPGVSILSTWNDGGTNSISGTSMASPHVAGTVALYIAENGAPTDANGVYDIRQALIDNGQPQSQWRNGDTEDPDGNPEPLVFVGSLSPPSPVTDIAISEVSASSSVTVGDIVSVDVTVDNVGNQDVTTDITVTLTDNTDATTIGSEVVSGGLTAGSSTILTYSWDTSSSTIGDHLLTALHDFSDDNSGNDSNSTTVTVNDTSNGGEVTVSGIDPNSVSSGSSISVTITGSGFASGASVSFENGSGPSPEASNIVVVSETEISATVTAKSGGPPRNRTWDVAVTNTDGSSGILAGEFTVTVN